VSGLYLASLSLAQFRSYAAVRLAFDGRSVVLWGPNGAGKTNILEAVSLLSPGRGLRGSQAGELARAPGALGWRIRAAVIGDDVCSEIVLTGEAGGRRRVEVDGKAETQAALGRLVPMLWLTPAMDRLWIEGAEGRRRFIDRAALSFVPGHAQASLRYERAMRERNRLLKEGPADPHWLDALEAQMAEAGVAIAAARALTVQRLMDAQTDAKTLFPKAVVSMIGDMETAFQGNGMAASVTAAAPAPQVLGIGDEFRATLGNGRAADARAGRALAGPHRSDLDVVLAAKGMPARQCSTGEQKALLLSLVLANARALAAAGVRPVILLDEVTAHLDEGRRAALFDEITGMGVQAFMTGTGPELFAALGARAQTFRVAETPDGSLVEAA
jgi:DNA replication and repair protein RecF